MTHPPLNLDISRELTEKVVMHKNIGQEVVVTTVDKLKLCLIEHQAILAGQREWIPALGLFLSFVATLCTATFRPVLLSPDTWKAIYIMAALLSCGWALYLIIRAAKSWNKGDADALIKRIVNQPKSAVVDSTALANLVSDFGWSVRDQQVHP